MDTSNTIIYEFSIQYAVVCGCWWYVAAHMCVYAVCTCLLTCPMCVIIIIIIRTNIIIYMYIYSTYDMATRAKWSYRLLFGQQRERIQRKRPEVIAIVKESLCKCSKEQGSHLHSGRPNQLWYPFSPHNSHLFSLSKSVQCSGISMTIFNLI